MTLDDLILKSISGITSPNKVDIIDVDGVARCAYDYSELLQGKFNISQIKSEALIKQHLMENCGFVNDDFRMFFIPFPEIHEAHTHLLIDTFIAGNYPRNYLYNIDDSDND